MGKINFKLFTLFGALAFVALAVSPVLAVAQSSNGNGGSDSSSSGNTQSSTSGSDNSNAQSSGNKLQGENLTKCKNKETNVNRYMLRITNRAQKQLNLFGTIAERVQTYYQDNKLSLDNYDELVSAVETTRTQAQNTFRAMEQNGGSFDCDSDDPHAYANQFRNSFNSAADGLKAYKTAVRNLIVGVRSVATEEAQSE